MSDAREHTTADPMLRIAISTALGELVLCQPYDADWHDTVDSATDQWFRLHTLPASIANLLPADLVAQVRIVDDCGSVLPARKRPTGGRSGVDLLRTCTECGIPLRNNLEYVEILGKKRPFCNECAMSARDFFGIEEEPEG